MNNFLLQFISKLIKLSPNNRLLILNYHRVLEQKEMYFADDISEHTFNSHVSMLKKYLNPISLTRSVKLLEQGKLPAGSVVITFDDGYKDNYTKALPILTANNLPACFFITTGSLNGGIMWNDIVIEAIKKTKKDFIDLSESGLSQYKLDTQHDKLTAIKKLLKYIKYKNLCERKVILKNITKQCDVNLPDNLMMTDEDVKKMYESGMDIGAHTVNHPILLCEKDDVVLDEMVKGKKYLEKLLAVKINTFAYPNGVVNQDYSIKHTELLKKAGFSLSVTTNTGINDKQTDVYQLNRFAPWDTNPVKFLLRLLKLYWFKTI